MKRLNLILFLVFFILVTWGNRAMAQLGCDTTTMNDTFLARGYKPLYIPSHPCSRYYYSNIAVDGVQARKVADSLHASVLVIDDLQENNEIAAAALAKGLFSTNGIWLGITDSNTLLTSWRTFKGSNSVSYFSWDAGNFEPNNLPSPCALCAPPGCTGGDLYWCLHGEDCVIMTANGNWWDVPCRSGPTGNIDVYTPIIEVNLCPTVSLPADTSVCPLKRVKVKAKADMGSSPYTYVWQPGNRVGDTVTLSAATPTTFSLSAVDYYKCQASALYNLGVYGLATNGAINLEKGFNSCIHNLDTLTVSNSSLTATYVWDFAKGNPKSIIGNKSYEIYWDSIGDKKVSVLISDSGCTQTARLTVHISRPSARFSILPDSDICPAYVLLVKAIDTLSPSKQYFWSFDSATAPIGSGFGPYQVSWDIAGIHPVTLIATDSLCSDTLTRTINVIKTVDAQFTVTGTKCPLNTLTFTYTGTLSTSNKYLWDFGTGIVLTGTGKGPYTVRWNSPDTASVSLTVSDGKCSSTIINKVIISPYPTVDAGRDTAICPGQPIKVGIPASTSYTYAWSPISNISNPNIARPTITLPANTTGAPVDTVYYLTATYNGCKSRDSIKIRIYPTINNLFTVTPSAACPGDTSRVLYSLYASPTALYTWNLGGATIYKQYNVAEYKLGWAVSGLKYLTLQVTDSGACATPPDTVLVTIYDYPVVHAGNDTTICSGGHATLGVKGTDTTTVFEWNPYSNLTGIRNPIATFLPKTNYKSRPDTFTYILTAGKNACIAYDTVHVYVTPAAYFPLAVVGTTSLCQGDSVILIDTLGSHVQFEWNTFTDTTATLIIKQPGNYGLSAIDTLGCEYLSSPLVSVTTSPLPTVVLDTLLTHHETCYGYNDGQVTAHGVGGTPGYTYFWTNTGQTGATASNLPPGTYSVTVADNRNCTATAGSVTILAALPMYVAIDSTVDVTCYGLANARLYASATGGRQPYSFVWSTGSIGAALLAVPSGTYRVSVTDSGGCRRDTFATVTQPPAISMSIPDVHIGYGDDTILTPIITPADNYIYQWYPTDRLSCSDCVQPTTTPYKDTTYTLYIQNFAGCRDSASVRVTIDKTKRYYVPNAFTPNGDQLNPNYLIFAKGSIKFFMLQVFDVWGEKVYQSNDIAEGWDGTYKGADMPSGNYVYLLTMIYPDGDVVNRKGGITLIR
jgi:gliding motility-associated-like protein